MSISVESSLKQATKGGAFVLAGLALNAVLLFAIKLIMVRGTSIETFGTYTLVISITMFISSLSCFGLHESVARFISVHSAHGETGEAGRFYASTLQIGLLIGAAVCVALFLGADVLAEHFFYKPEIALPLRISSLMIPAYIALLLGANALRGYGIIAPKVYFMDVLQPLAFMLVLFVLLLSGITVLSAVAGYIASFAIALAGLLWYAKSRAGVGFPLLGEGGRKMEMFRFSMNIFIASLMMQLLGWADTLVLGRYGTAADVGVYNIALTLSLLLTLPMAAIGFVIMPIAGSLYGQQKNDELRRVFQVLTKWTFSGLLPMFLVLFIFPETVLRFLFGERFLPAVLPLRVLSTGFLALTMAGPSGQILMIMGMTKQLLAISAVGAVLNITLNYMLIKQAGLGMLGASAATAISYSTISVLSLLILHRMTGLHPFSLNYIRPAAITLLLGAGIYAVTSGSPTSPWLLPLYFAAFVSAHLAVSVLTRSIDSEDVYIIGQVSGTMGFDSSTLQRFLARFARP